MFIWSVGKYWHTWLKKNIKPRSIFKNFIERNKYKSLSAPIPKFYYTLVPADSRRGGVSHLECVFMWDPRKRRAVHLHDGVSGPQPRALRHWTFFHARYVHTYTCINALLVWIHNHLYNLTEIQSEKSQKEFEQHCDPQWRIYDICFNVSYMTPKT